jgi:hypothetical protein
LIDRSGNLSRNRARVRFTFGTGIFGLQVIARVQVLDDAGRVPEPKGPSPDLPDARWRILGSTEVGNGELVTSEGSAERFFLITKLHRKSDVDPTCCEATELVCVEDMRDFTLPDIVILHDRIQRLIREGAGYQTECE